VVEEVPRRVPAVSPIRLDQITLRSDRSGSRSNDLDMARRVDLPRPTRLSAAKIANRTDVGTGHGGLSYMLQASASNMIKIDKMFVDALGTRALFPRPFIEMLIDLQRRQTWGWRSPPRGRRDVSSRSAVLRRCGIYIWRQGPMCFAPPAAGGRSSDQLLEMAHPLTSDQSAPVRAPPPPRGSASSWRRATRDPRRP